MLPTITIEGRAVEDAELRFTPSGAAVASFRVAASKSKKRDDGTWEDGERIFINVSVWKDDAETVAEQVRKGDPLLITGRLYQREYERRDGSKGTSLELDFPTVAKVIKAPRAARGTPQQATAPARDPWATPGPFTEPPF